MQMNIQDCKDRTRELADTIVLAQLQRQEALLSVPSVLFAVNYDLTLGLSSQQNAFSRIFSAVRLDGTWLPVHQLSHEQAVGFARGLLDDIALHYPSVVSNSGSGSLNSSIVEFAPHKLSSVFKNVVLSDLYLKDFFDVACDIDEPRLVDQFHRSQKDLQAAITEMMEVNSGAFRTILRPYMEGDRNTDDIEAEAYEGFYRACVKYFPDAGSTFYGVLMKWVQARVVRFLDRDSSILSISRTSGTFARKIRRARLNLEQEGKVVSLTDVARELNVAAKDVSACEEAFGSWSEYSEVIHVDAGSVGGGNPEVLCSKADDKELVREMLSKLTNREAQVLAGRYGLGCSPKTLDEIGQSLGVTLEAVRQTQVRAEKKLFGLYGAAVDLCSFR